jgi:EmrB/QacA subfamily drug resistance transporter
MKQHGADCSEDRTIISVAIPDITDRFNSLDDVGWYGSAYMITGASFSLIFGKIYKHYSIKNVFLASIVLFEVGSAVCGAAPSSIALILGRAIAGLGSSGIFTGGMMVIVPLIPLRKRPIYYGLFGAVFGVASVLGPFLGGAFTDKLSWRWCFYVNLPVGAFTIVAIVLFLHIKPPRSEKLSPLQHLIRLDPIGSFLFIPSIVCLVLALQWGGVTYAWTSARIIGLLVTCGVLFAAFWILQAFTPKTATVPLRIAAQRSVFGGVVFLFLMNGSLFAVVYFLPIWFEAVKSETAIHAGESLFPLVISLVIMSILAGGFTQRVGYYMPPIMISPVLTTAGAVLLTRLTTSSGPSRWISDQVVYGFGTGMAMQTVNMAAQTVLDRVDISTGMALNFFGQNLGGAIFVAVAQNIFQSKLTKKLSGIPGIPSGALNTVGILDLSKAVPPQLLPQVQKAFNTSVTNCLYVAVALSAATLIPALFMEWKTIKSGAEVKAAARDLEVTHVSIAKAIGTPSSGSTAGSKAPSLYEKAGIIINKREQRGSKLKAEYYPDGRPASKDVTESEERDVAQPQPSPGIEQSRTKPKTEYWSETQTSREINKHEEITNQPEPSLGIEQRGSKLRTEYWSDANSRLQEDEHHDVLQQESPGLEQRGSKLKTEYWTDNVAKPVEYEDVGMPGSASQGCNRHASAEGNGWSDERYCEQQ